jgi:hypothetical protein
MNVTGELSGEQTDWLGMHAAHWRLRQVSGALLPAPDLTSDAALADVGFLGVHWDSAASPVHLGNQSLDLLSTRVWAGDTLLNLAGHADWTGSTWKLELSRAEALSRQFHWTADAPVRFAGDPRGVTFDRLEARDSLATMSIRGRWAAPGGSYDWEGRVRALDLAHLGLPPEWRLAGAADGVLHVTGPSGDPRWQLTAATHAPTFGGHRGDSLALDISGSKSRVDIGHALFRIGGGSLEAKGHVTDIATPWPDSLTGTAVLRWLESSATWDGELGLDAMPIERVTGLFPSTAGWSGRLSGKMAIAGNPDRPRLDTQLSVADLTWRDFNVSRLDVDARYADERLTLVKVQTVRDELGSSAEGEVPVRISFRRPSQMLDVPMDVHVRLANGDLRILPRLLPQIGTAGGRVQAELDVRGTGKRPEIEGHARIQDGSLRLAGRSELLEHVFRRGADEAVDHHPRFADRAGGRSRPPEREGHGEPRGRPAHDVSLQPVDARFHRIGPGPLRGAVRRRLPRDERPPRPRSAAAVRDGDGEDPARRDPHRFREPDRGAAARRGERAALLAVQDRRHRREQPQVAAARRRHRVQRESHGRADAHRAPLVRRHERDPWHLLLPQQPLQRGAGRPFVR